MNAARKFLGYVPEFPMLCGYLSVGRCWGHEWGGGDIDWALQGPTGDDADRYIREYSQGMRRKTAIACALVAKPKLLILDESLNGLDPPSSLRVLGALENLRTEGTAILLSTHILDTLEKVASRILMIEEGRIAADVPASELGMVRSMFSKRPKS